MKMALNGAKLIHLKKGKPGTVLDVTSDKVVIGSDIRSDIRIHKADVERQHCSIERRGPKVILVNCSKSSNVLLNGTQVLNVSDIKTGDTITVSNRKFVWNFDDASAEPFRRFTTFDQHQEHASSQKETTGRSLFNRFRQRQSVPEIRSPNTRREVTPEKQIAIVKPMINTARNSSAGTSSTALLEYPIMHVSRYRSRSLDYQQPSQSGIDYVPPTGATTSLIQKRTPRMSTGNIGPLMCLGRRKSIRSSSTLKIAKLKKATQHAIDATVKSIQDTVGRISSTKKNQKKKAKTRVFKNTPKKREYVKKPAVKRKFSEEEVNIMNSKKRKLNSPAPDAKKKAALMVLTATPEQSVKKNEANYPNHAYTTEIPKQFKFGESSFGDTSVASTSTANVQWNTSKRLKRASATKKNRDSLRKSVLKTPLKKVDLSQNQMYNDSIKSDESLLQSISDNESIVVNDESYTGEVSLSPSIEQETNSFSKDKKNVSSKKQTPVNPRRSTRFNVECNNSAPSEENKSIIINKNSDEITKHTPVHGMRRSMRNNPEMSIQNSLLLDIFNTPSTSKIQHELIDSSLHSENNDFIDNSLPLIDKTFEVSQINSRNNTHTTRNQTPKSSNKSSRISNINLSTNSSDSLNAPSTPKKSFSNMTEIASKTAQTENVIDCSILSENCSLDSSIPTSNRTFEVSQADSNKTHTARLNNTYINISLMKSDVEPNGNQSQSPDIFNTPSTSKVADFKTKTAGNEVLSTQSETSGISQNTSSSNTRTTRTSNKYEKAVYNINRSQKSLVNLKQTTNSNATVEESLNITKNISNVPAQAGLNSNENNVTKTSELEVGEKNTSMNELAQHSHTRSSNRISNQNHSRSKIPVLTPNKVPAHTSTPKNNRKSDSEIFKTPASVVKLRSNKSLTYSSAKNIKTKELICDQSIIEEEVVENSLNISTPVASKKMPIANKCKSIIFDHTVNNSLHEENVLHKPKSAMQLQSAGDSEDDLVDECSPQASESNTSVSKNHHLTLPIAKVRRTNRKLSLSSSFRANTMSSKSKIDISMVSFNEPSNLQSFNLEQELDTSAMGSKQSVTLPLAHTKRSTRNASMIYAPKNNKKIDIFETPSIVVTSNESFTGKTDNELLKDLTSPQSTNEVFENALTSSTPEASKKLKTLSKSKSVVFDPSLFSTSIDDSPLLHPDLSGAQLQSTGDSEHCLVEESSSPVLESNESVSNNENVVKRSHHLTLPLVKARRTSRKLSLSSSLEVKATSSKASASEITKDTLNESQELSDPGLEFDTSVIGSKHSITLPLVHRRRSIRNMSMMSHKDTKTEMFNVPSEQAESNNDDIGNYMISDSKLDNEEKTPENREMPVDIGLQFESTPISSTRRSGRISELVHGKNTSTQILRTVSDNKSGHAGDLDSISNDEQSVTPKTTIKLLAEVVKKQHSTAKKSVGRRTIDPEILLHPLSTKTKELINMDEDGRKREIINSVKSPENNLLNVSGVKKLFTTKSPKNDLSNVAGIRNLFDQQDKVKSPKNDLTSVVGVKTLFDQQRRILSPKNDLTNITGIKHSLQCSPLNTYEVSGIESLFKENAAEETTDNMDNSFDRLISKPVIKRTYANRSKSLSPLKHQKESIRQSVGYVLQKDVDVKIWLEEQKAINNKQNEKNQIVSANTISNEITEAEPSTSSVPSIKQPKLRARRLYSATDGIYDEEMDTADMTDLPQCAVVESDHPAFTPSHLLKRKKPLMDPRLKELSKKLTNKPRNKKQTSNSKVIEVLCDVDPDITGDEPKIPRSELRQCFVLIDELKNHDGVGSSQKENAVIRQGELDLTNDDTPNKMKSVVDVPVAPILKLKKGKKETKEVQKAAELEQIESAVSTIPLKRSTRTRGIKKQNGSISTETEIEKTESNVSNTPLKRSARVKASKKHSESSSKVDDPPLKRTRKAKKENTVDTVEQSSSASITEIVQTPSKRTRRAKAVTKDQIETKASVKNAVENEYELDNAVESKTPLKRTKNARQNANKDEKENEEAEKPLKRTRRAKQVVSEDNISEITPEVKTSVRRKGRAKETVSETVLENGTPLKRTRGRNATKEAKNSEEQDEISLSNKRTRKGGSKIAEASPKIKKLLDSKINEDEPSKTTKRSTRARGANKEQDNYSEVPVTAAKRGRGAKGKTDENAELETVDTGKSEKKTELEQAGVEKPQRVTRSRKKIG